MYKCFACMLSIAHMYMYFFECFVLIFDVCQGLLHFDLIGLIYLTLLDLVCVCFQDDTDSGYHTADGSLGAEARRYRASLQPLSVRKPPGEYTLTRDELRRTIEAFNDNNQGLIMSLVSHERYILWCEPISQRYFDVSPIFFARFSATGEQHIPGLHPCVHQPHSSHQYVACCSSTVNLRGTSC